MNPWFKPEAGLRVILGPALCRWCEYPVWLCSTPEGTSSEAVWLELHRGHRVICAGDVRFSPAINPHDGIRTLVGHVPPDVAGRIHWCIP